MSDEDYERGRSDERLDANDLRHQENQARFESIEAKLTEIANIVAAAKGGLRVLYALGAIAAGVGAFSHTFFGWLSNHWK